MVITTFFKGFKDDLVCAGPSLLHRKSFRAIRHTCGSRIFQPMVNDWDKRVIVTDVDESLAHSQVCKDWNILSNKLLPLIKRNKLKQRHYCIKDSWKHRMWGKTHNTKSFISIVQNELLIHLTVFMHLQRHQTRTIHELSRVTTVGNRWCFRHSISQI